MEKSEREATVIESAENGRKRNKGGRKELTRGEDKESERGKGNRRKKESEGRNG